MVLYALPTMDYRGVNMDKEAVKVIADTNLMIADLASVIALLLNSDYEEAAAHWDDAVKTKYTEIDGQLDTLAHLAVRGKI